MYNIGTTIDFLIFSDFYSTVYCLETVKILALTPFRSVSRALRSDLVPLNVLMLKGITR